jgi:hypothetical protein
VGSSATGAAAGSSDTATRVPTAGGLAAAAGGPVAIPAASSAAPAVHAAAAFAPPAASAAPPAKTSLAAANARAANEARLKRRREVSSACRSVTADEQARLKWCCVSCSGHLRLRFTCLHCTCPDLELMLQTDRHNDCVKICTCRQSCSLCCRPAMLLTPLRFAVPPELCGSRLVHSPVRKCYMAT